MDVEHWINTGKDYQLGLKLFKKLGGSATLFAYFSSGENSLSKRKLQEQLLALSTPILAEPKIEVQKAEAKPEPAKEPVIKENFRGFFENLPSEVSHINSLRLETFKKMAALHQSLCAMEGNGPKTIEKRYKIMVQILELDKTNRECWKKLIYFKENNALPAEDGAFNPKALTIRELVNLEKVIPTYITKEKKKLEKPLSPEKIELVQANILKYELQLKQVKEIINSLPALEKIPC